MPTPEVVLNKPLSGEEVRRIILSQLERKLAGDTRLADYVAYPAFQFKLDLAIILTGAVHDKIDHNVTGKGGDLAAQDNPESPATAVMHHVEQGQMPPNEARVESGLGVPVLTHDEKGRQVEREVKYDKEKKNQVVTASPHAPGRRTG